MPCYLKLCFSHTKIFDLKRTKSLPILSCVLSTLETIYTYLKIINKVVNTFEYKKISEKVFYNKQTVFHSIF